MGLISCAVDVRPIRVKFISENSGKFLKRY